MFFLVYRENPTYMSKYLKSVQTLNVVGILGVITINILANTLPINNVTTGEVSANYSNLFTPAGFTFSIWSIIYLGLTGFLVYQTPGLFSKNFQDNNMIVGLLGITVFISCIANFTWIIAWHHEQFSLTLLLMSLLLLSLIDINRRIYRYSTQHDVSKAFRWLVAVPFGIYLGWICVATTANMAVFLTAIEWNMAGLPEEFWTVLMILVSAIIAILLVVIWQNISAALSIIWGIVGIYFNQFDTNNFNMIMTSCLIAAILILLTTAMVIKPKKVSP